MNGFQSYYLSDDMKPNNPKNLGKDIDSEWPVAESLFYVLSFEDVLILDNEDGGLARSLLIDQTDDAEIFFFF